LACALNYRPILAGDKLKITKNWEIVLTKITEILNIKNQYLSNTKKQESPKSIQITLKEIWAEY